MIVVFDVGILDCSAVNLFAEGNECGDVNRLAGCHGRFFVMAVIHHAVHEEVLKRDALGFGFGVVVLVDPVLGEFFAVSCHEVYLFRK